MIEPFCPSRLRPASYQLTLGKEAHVGGVHQLIDESDGIILEPHQVAVVSTREILRIPRDVIARWSLRVTNIYEGLLWTGGPQVDPGWEGQLFCPIYNLAERTVVLKYGDPLFTIDFVRTTSSITPELKELKEDYPKVWFTPQRQTTLSAHDSHRLHSAPFEALRELKELQRFREFGYSAIGVTFAVLAIMVAALAVVAVVPPVETEGPPFKYWPWIVFAASIASFVMSLLTIIVVYKRGSRS